MPPRRTLAAVPLAALLACGGGAGTTSSPPAAPPAAPPSPAATPSPPATPAPPSPPAPTAPQPAPGAGPQPTAAAPQPVAPIGTGWRLVWADEFDGSAVDPARWKVHAMPRGDAVTTPDALTVADGILRFTTYDDAGVHRTGFLSTEGGLFEATFGYFEARIRFHTTPGEWCAFWLMSPTVGTPLGDPATAGTEIDVVEHRFTDESGWQLADWVGQNVLWDGYGKDRKDDHHVAPAPGGAHVQGEWHTFAVLWDATGYRFFVDADEVWATSKAVSRRSEFVLLTCEVLDHEWAGSVPPGGFGTRETSTTGMDVDWVRVWQR